MKLFIQINYGKKDFSSSQKLKKKFQYFRKIGRKKNALYIIKKLTCVICGWRKTHSLNNVCLHCATIGDI